MAAKLVEKRSIKAMRAQALVEFALTLPILMFMTFAIIEFGRMLFTYVTVYSAAHEAARYGSATGYLPNGSTYRYDDCAGIIQSAQSFEYMNDIEVHVYIEYWAYPDETSTDPTQVNPIPEICNNGTQTGPTTSDTIPSETFKDDNKYMRNRPRLIVTTTSQYVPIVPIPGIGSLTITSTSRKTLVGPIFIRSE